MIQSFGYVLLMNLAQLPGYFAAARLVETWGRKKTLAAFLLMTAVSAFLFGSSGTVSTLLLSGALLNFFNLGAWGALYAYTPENYPVEIRASGAGFASAFGRIGSMIAPVFMGVLVAHRFSYGAIFAIYTAVLISGALVLMLAGTETKQETITT
jgi:putative MFS transporter